MSKHLLNAAKPASSFGRETFSGCLSCGDQIRHPICPDCIATGYRQWVSKFSDDSSEIMKKLDMFLKGHKKFNGGSLRCVSCGEKKTHLCPYCFTNFLYKITKEAGVGVRVLSEFLFIFNFDFEHEGYSRELEFFGGY